MSREKVEQELRDEWDAENEEFDIEALKSVPIPYDKNSPLHTGSHLPSLRELTSYDIDLGADGRPLIDPSLRLKQQFVFEFFDRGSLGDAYRAVYDPHVRTTVAMEKGRELIQKDQFIRDLLTVARARIEDNSASLLAEHAANLGGIRDLALRAGKFAPAVASEIQRGKALGLYESNIELLLLPFNERKNIADMLLAGE
jgi:hypothetical protein